MVDGLFLGYVLRAVGGWSGDLRTADNEDLRSSPKRQVHEQMFKHQEVLVKTPYHFSCVEERIKLFDGPHLRHWPRETCSKKRVTKSQKRMKTKSKKANIISET